MALLDPDRITEVPSFDRSHLGRELIRRNRGLELPLITSSFGRWGHFNEQSLARHYKFDLPSTRIGTDPRDDALAATQPDYRAQILWEIVQTLRDGGDFEIAEDLFLNRLVDWISDRDYEAASAAIDIAARACLDLIGLPYDDEIDEQISTYVVLLGITSSEMIRREIGTSLRPLYDNARRVVASGQGEEIARKLMDRLA